jgi:hypothetical protein
MVRIGSVCLLSPLSSGLLTNSHYTSDKFTTKSIKTVPNKFIRLGESTFMLNFKIKLYNQN